MNYCWTIASRNGSVIVNPTFFFFFFIGEFDIHLMMLGCHLALSYNVTFLALDSNTIFTTLFSNAYIF